MGIQIPESNFVLSGDMFKAEIFVTAFNKDRNPDVYVGEYDSLPDGTYKMRGKEGVDYQVVPVENGRGIYEVRTGAQGPKKVGRSYLYEDRNRNKILSIYGRISCCF